MTKLTAELLETIATWREKYGNGANVMIPAEEAELMARRILAYEQAAKNPVMYKVVSLFGDISYQKQKCKEGLFSVSVTPLYAAPVLPKQPELIGMKVSIDTGSDNIGHRLFGEIVGTSDSNGVPVLCIEVAENNGDMAAPAQPVIPEGLIKAINRLLDNDGSRGCFDALEQHRAKTELELLLAAEQQNEPQNIPENIPENIATAHSAYISFDALMAAVSEVTGAKSEFDATPEKCYQAVPFMNFNSLSRIVEMFRTAQPVSEPYKLPDGWKLVPEQATIAMLTLLGLTGSFDFMQQKYKNMLAAATAQEQK